MAESAECNHCGASLSASHSGACPYCGQDAGKAIRAALADKIEVTDFVDARGVPEGRGRSAYYQRVQSGKEVFRKTGRMHQVERNIDRRANRYYEHIEDAETGEVVRHKDGQLNQHVAERDLHRIERAEDE